MMTRPVRLLLSIGLLLPACVHAPVDPPTADDADTFAHPEITEAGSDSDTFIVPVSPPPWPERWEVLVSPDAPAILQTLATEIAETLTAMGTDAEVLTQTGLTVDCDLGVGRAVVAGDGLSKLKLDTLDVTGQTWRYEETRCERGAVVTLMGGGLLGRQYAAYRWLHHLGVRYFHPEETFIPEALPWHDSTHPQEATPTLAWRSVSLNLNHPIELGDALMMGDESAQAEVTRWIDWQVHNLASGVDAHHLTQDLARQHAQDRGLMFRTHLRLYGGNDPVLPSPGQAEDITQITNALDAAAEDGAKVVTFDVDNAPPSVDDDMILAHLIAATEHAIEQHPALAVAVKADAHTPTPSGATTVLELATATPNRMGLVVMLPRDYDLFRPAPVPGGSLASTYAFIVAQHFKRPVFYGSHASNWPDRDISLPLYLPLQMDSRARDLAAMADLADGDGRLAGMILEGSGHEWGYWQSEVCALHLAHDPSPGLTGCLADLTAPFGAMAGEVHGALSAAIASQGQGLLQEGLMRWLTSEDLPDPHDVMLWPLEETEAWRVLVGAGLDRVATDHADAVAQLGGCVEAIPKPSQPWLFEIIDGLDAVRVRAQHVRQRFDSLISFREGRLRFDSELAGQAPALQAAAEDSTREALAVVSRRETDYRYMPISRAIGGGAAGDEDMNWTQWTRRYLNHAHHVTRYQQEDAMTRVILEAADGVFNITDVLLAPGETLEVSGNCEELSVDFGDETAATGPTISHLYEAPGVYDATAQGVVEGQELTHRFNVIQMSDQYHAGFTGSVITPPTADILSVVFPALTIGHIGEDTMALGFGADDTGQIGPDQWVLLTCEPHPDLRFNCYADRIIVAAKDPFGPVGFVGSLVFLGAHLTVDFDGLCEFSGVTLVDSIIEATVAFAGYEPADALSLVAGLLGYTPETIPADVPLAIAYSFTMAPEADAAP